MALVALFNAGVISRYGSGVGGANRKIFVAFNPHASGKVLLVRGWNLAIGADRAAISLATGVQIYREQLNAGQTVSGGTGGTLLIAPALKVGANARSAIVAYDADGATAITYGTPTASTKTLIHGIETNAASNNDGEPAISRVNFHELLSGTGLNGYPIDPGWAFIIEQHNNLASQAGFTMNGSIFFEERNSS